MLQAAHQFNTLKKDRFLDRKECKKFLFQLQLAVPSENL